MPSFAEMKERAGKASSATMSKLGDTKDRMKSTSSKNLDVMDPDYQKSRPPPPPMKVKPKWSGPPPPTRSDSVNSGAPTSPPIVSRSNSLAAGPAPPPVSRNTRPDTASSLAPPPPIRRAESGMLSPLSPFPSSPSAYAPSPISSYAPPRPPPPARREPPASSSYAPPVSSSYAPPASSSYAPPRPPPPARRVEAAKPDNIDWTNLSAEDKEVFFAWLDEFFAGYLKKPIPTANGNLAKGTFNAVKSSIQPRTASPPVAAAAAPKVASWTRPKPVNSVSNYSNQTAELVMTYPPTYDHGCLALEVVHYFQKSTHWDSAWYDTTPPSAPPPIAKGDTWTMAGQGIGTKKELWYGVMGRDLSIAWCTVGFSTTGPSNPNATTRSACYLPCPEPLDKEALVSAHETYGETIASFAEGYVEAQQYCGRGECWDLASEALKVFAQFDWVPKPIPSLAHTHGHLILWFRAENGKQAGKWFGGDDRVRRGDIVQWRSVQIMVSVPGGQGTASLGAPDHTSIVVSDTIPAKTPYNGGSLRPDEFGSLEVAEQSVSTNGLPKVQQYEMAGMSAGEAWIYRPIGMKDYLGVEFDAKCPEGVNALTL